MTVYCGQYAVLVLAKRQGVWQHGASSSSWENAAAWPGSQSPGVHRRTPAEIYCNITLFRTASWRIPLATIGAKTRRVSRCWFGCLSVACLLDWLEVDAAASG